MSASRSELMTDITLPQAGAAQPILELDHISKRFTRKLDVAERIANLLGANRRETTVHAVDGVSFSIEKGEVLGLVGESGCGKSTLGRVVANIHSPSDGTLKYRGKSISEMSKEEERDYTLNTQMIFQDPMSSLNPRMRVREIIGEAPKVHGLITGDYDGFVDEIMLKVGLDPAYKKRFPHQFSGGQRQRIGIARAMAVNPKLIVCDESVAALDVSIQAQVLNLFMKLRADLDLTYLFISHDLGVVEHISDRVVIMYLGRVVESASTDELFNHPSHPYTQALLKEVPRVNTGRKVFEPIKGEIPSPINPPRGCHFHPRCPMAHERCRVEIPAMKTIGNNHISACHLND